MGLFPGAFVEKMILPKKLILAQVIQSFAATNTDEIDIAEKDVIEIMHEGEFSYWFKSNWRSFFVKDHDLLLFRDLQNPYLNTHLCN